MSDAYDLDGQAWRNRIEGFDMVPPDSLLANERNWRVHPKAQQDVLAGTLTDVGWVGVVMVNLRTSDEWDDNSRGVATLVDGHARVKLALRNDEPEIPAIFVDLSPAEEAEVLATYDPIAAMAAADAEMLDDVLRDVQTGDEAIQQMLAEMAEREGLAFGDNGHEEADAEPEIDRAEELREKWGVELGQLWALGEHRLICGDATDAATVKRLLDGAEPRLMVTDPPYGVEYDQEWRSSNRIGRVANDDNPDWRGAYKLSPAEVVYVWHASRHAIQVESGLQAASFEQRAQIIWNKPRHVFSQGHYHWKHEPCLYSVRSGATAKWIGDRKQNTVWDIEQDEDAPGNHSTQKPLECMERPIRNHEGDVYDPFLGSGTTIIAAENQGRTCYACEIEPKYVAVALDRYERAFGVTAELVE